MKEVMKITSTIESKLKMDEDKIKKKLALLKFRQTEKIN